MSDNNAWKVLIVDDEPEVHILTRTVLKNVSFNNKPILFLSAYDAESTRQILDEESDIALILLDLVMEEEYTSLELVRYIREELKNRLTRIILRTGVPGTEPARRIIVDYEINDYKEKTDLTTPGLFTSVIKSLRNYQDLVRMKKINAVLEKSREGLTRVIHSSADLFASRTIRVFLGELINQTSLMLDRKSRVQFSHEESENTFDPGLIGALESLKFSSHTLLYDDYFIGRLSISDVNPLYLIADNCTSLHEDEIQMLEIFFSNANIMYNNLTLKEEFHAAQSEMIGLLGDVIENRSRELFGHQNRVSEYALILARKLEIPEEEITTLQDAVKLHDTGKIGIFDSILDKPGPLTSEEFNTMKSHTTIGYEILRFSSRKLCQMAAAIAWEHHERWDGSGYPRGLSGKNIHQFGRITCIVDVFDALTSERVYRKAWHFEKTIQFIKDGRGTQFDPLMVNLFLEEQDHIKEIMVRNTD